MDLDTKYFKRIPYFGPLDYFFCLPFCFYNIATNIFSYKAWFALWKFLKYSLYNNDNKHLHLYFVF